MQAGMGLKTLCVAKHGSPYKTNFTSLKPVLAFQTLTLAMLGKWATTQGRVFSWARTALGLCCLAWPDFKPR